MHYVIPQAQNTTLPSSLWVRCDYAVITIPYVCTYGVWLFFSDCALVTVEAVKPMTHEWEKSADNGRFLTADNIIICSRTRKIGCCRPIFLVRVSPTLEQCNINIRTELNCKWCKNVCQYLKRRAERKAVEPVVKCREVRRRFDGERQDASQCRTRLARALHHD